MLNIRTDLAAEAHSINAARGVDDGIILTDTRCEGISVTQAEIKSGEGEQRSGRRAGVYLTADIGRVWTQSGEERKSATRAVSKLLKRLLPDTASATVLVAGLGNADITPDAIGPQTVNRLVVTHHLKTLNPPLYSALGVGDMAAVCVGVLGKTGVESATLIKCAVSALNPCCVIAVDALAAGSVSRLGTTVQLTDTGIAPGSGVQNGRQELSAATLGCPVIGVGVPTVVDARTIVAELGDSAGENLDSFFVTPKETDLMVRVVSTLLAQAINSAVHPNTEDIEEYAPL